MEDLWKIRLRKQMTVAQLSSRAGVPARRIQEYEAGTRSIPMSDLEKLARALFVDIMEIKSLSDPIPPELAAAPAPRPAAPGHPTPTPAPAAAPAPPSKEARPRRPAPAKPQLAPARPSQLAHLQMLAKRFDWDQARLEQEIGKPLAELTRPEASRWLKTLQERIASEAPQKGKRRRPYLPESVDAFELRYLQSKQEEGALLKFTLFNGQEFTGRIVGFGPYNITIGDANGQVTLNKLAIAYYRTVEGEAA